MNPLQAPGAAALLLWRTVRALRHDPLPWRACLEQMVELGTRSLGLVISGMAFFGGVMVTIANAQARKLGLGGSLEVVGPPYFELLVREFGPAISALLIAARLGASASAELSTASVTEQAEALEMSAGDPKVDWVAPRVVASMLSVPALTLIGVLSAGVAAALTASSFGADGWAFLDGRSVTVADLVCALVKALACGLYIPLVASEHGLAARGGAAAVGAATTEGVVSACMGALVIDLLITLGFQLAGA
jgi:phospholipid/cholesterol/gamma-HCH transport system permease protein